MLNLLSLLELGLLEHFHGEEHVLFLFVLLSYEVYFAIGAFTEDFYLLEIFFRIGLLRLLEIILNKALHARIRYFLGKPIVIRIILRCCDFIYDHIEVLIVLNSSFFFYLANGCLLLVHLNWDWFNFLHRY
jgi:hypothetical protein